jgi:hypothetical protein
VRHPFRFMLRLPILLVSEQLIDRVTLLDERPQQVPDADCQEQSSKGAGHDNDNAHGFVGRDRVTIVERFKAPGALGEDQMVEGVPSWILLLPVDGKGCSSTSWTKIRSLN